MTHQDLPGRRYTAAQIAALTAAGEPWLSCDGCFDELDGAVDALAGGARLLDEPLRVHLARCPACLEEAETLLVLAAQDRGADEERLLERLRSLVDA